MRERDNSHLLNHVKRFFADTDQATQELERMLEQDPQLTKAQIFRQMSAGKGSGKSHVSRYQADHYDGQRKK